MLSFTALSWVALIIGALGVGLAKTALPGLATISVALFAAALPAKESTAALLLLLMVGDIFAIVAYRRSADWKTLRALVPYVLVGIVLGALFLNFVSNDIMKRAIGVILLALIALTLYLRYGKPYFSERRNAPPSAPKEVEPADSGELEQSGRAAGSVAARLGYGTLSGFTTMAANAGGPVMSLYLLSAKFDVMRFLGTSAWFFFVVNVIKLPFSASIGLIDGSTLRLVAVLVPMTVVGALAGRWLAPRMTNAVFDPIVWVLTIVGAVALLL